MLHTLVGFTSGFISGMSLFSAVHAPNLQHVQDANTTAGAAFEFAVSRRRQEQLPPKAFSAVQEAATRAIRVKPQRQHGDATPEWSGNELDAMPRFAVISEPDFELQQVARLREATDRLNNGSAARPPAVKLWAEGGKQRFSCG